MDISSFETLHSHSPVQASEPIPSTHHFLTQFNSSDNSVTNITFERLHNCLSLLPESSRSFLYPLETIATIAPGRVNLIGEHIDYEGFPVLPMAISLNTICILSIIKRPNIFKSNEPCIICHFVNAQEDLYPSESITFNPMLLNTIPIGPNSSSWIKYPLCAIKAFLLHLSKVKNVSSILSNHTIEFNFSYDGNIPPAAGLSSSSAMVCATVSSLFSSKFSYSIFKKSYSRSQLTKISQDCERFIGMESGGMDQAICFFAEKQKATRINFRPNLSFEQVPLDSVFSNSKLLVINSNENSFKHLTMGENYNYRVTECKMASLLLDSKHKALTIYDALTSLTFLKPPKNDILNIKYLESVVNFIKNESIIPNHPITFEEFANLYNSVKPEKNAQELSTLLSKSVKDQITSVSKFNLYSRAIHVISETIRVLQFQQHLNLSPSLATLGSILMASHYSLSTLYECSTPTLDDIVFQLSQAGSYGSRLVGAGWGGCCISLIPLDFSLPQSLQNLDHFYCYPAQGLQSFHIPNILVCSDSWKDSLPSSEVNAAITSALKLSSCLANIMSVPLSDGGEGFLDLTQSDKFDIYSTNSIHGPLTKMQNDPTSVESTFEPFQQTLDSVPYAIGKIQLFSSDSNSAPNLNVTVGVVEMAKSSGIELVPNSSRNPLHTTTFGTGQLISECIKKGATQIILGVGGSSTNDAGLGALQALGLNIYTSQGLVTHQITGSDLSSITKIRWQDDAIAHKIKKLWIGCDVNNPFYGSNGAVAVYSAQKGATSEIQVLLEKGMENLVTNVFPEFIKFSNNKESPPSIVQPEIDFGSKSNLGLSDSKTNTMISIAEDTQNIQNLGLIPKTGAAGGISGGFLYCLGSETVTLASGFEIFSSITGLNPLLENADIIFSGEGKLDSQSLQGKVLSKVYNISKTTQSKLIFIVGAVDDSMVDTPNVYCTSTRYGIQESLTNPRICIRNIVQRIFSD